MLTESYANVTVCAGLKCHCDILLQIQFFCIGAYEKEKGAVTDKSQPRHKKYTQFYREEGVFFGIIYV